MPRTLTILDALIDEQLFKRFFPLTTWRPWFLCTAALFGLTQGLSRAKPTSACLRCCAPSSATRTRRGRLSDPRHVLWLSVLGSYLTVTELVWPGLRAASPDARPRLLLAALNTV